MSDFILHTMCAPVNVACIGRVAALVHESYDLGDSYGLERVTRCDLRRRRYIVPFGRAVSAEVGVLSVQDVFAIAVSLLTRSNAPTDVWFGYVTIGDMAHFSLWTSVGSFEAATEMLRDFGVGYMVDTYERVTVLMP